MQKQKVSIKVIFNKEDKILFVKDHKDVWELPGGRVEFGEQPEETLKREIEEELGYKDVKIIKPIHAWSFSSTFHEETTQYIIFVYECEAVNLEIKENEEYKEYRWIPTEEVPSLNTREGYKESIKKYTDSKSLE